MWEIRSVIRKPDGEILFELMDTESYKYMTTDYKHLPNEIKKEIKGMVEKWWQEVYAKILGFQ